jgi:hypothetical protein
MDVLKDLGRKITLIAPEPNLAKIRLGLFSRSGFTKEVEEIGRKGEIVLVDTRKIGL